MGKAKYHHLIAQTYLRSWTLGNDSIYAFNKDDLDLIGIKNIANNFGINNFHTIKVGMPICTEEDLKIIFSPLNEYSITYKGSILSDLKEYNRTYFDYSEWIIINSSGQAITRAEKNNFKTTIDQTKILDIEERWARDYEDGWGSLRDMICQRVSDTKSADIPEFYKGKLMKFIVSMDWRSFSSNEILAQSFQALNDVIKLDDIHIPFPERTIPQNNTIMKENIHYYLLKLFRSFLEREGIMYTVATEYIKRFSIILLVSKGNNKFITSDNPSFTYKENDGILHLMPITPQIVAIIGNDSQKRGFYEMRYASLNDVKKVNNLIIENAYDMIIASEETIIR